MKAFLVPSPPTRTGVFTARPRSGTLSAGLAALMILSSCNKDDDFSPTAISGLSNLGTGTPSPVATKPIIPAPTPSGTTLPKPSPIVPSPTLSPSPPPLPGSGTVSCNPLNSAGSSIGVYAIMKYIAPSQLNLDPTSPEYGYTTNLNIGNFGDLWNSPHSQTAGTAFYFSNINIENQRFSDGFRITDAAGATVPLTYPIATPTPEGLSAPLPGISPNLSNLIVSYFALEFSFNLQLPADSPDMAYDFRVASDDGSLTYVNGNLEIPYINNDGVHAVVVQQSASPLILSATKPTSFLIDWFQGPPYYLQLILSYRLTGSNQPFVVVPANLFHLPPDATAPAGLCPTANATPSIESTSTPTPAE